MAAPQSTPLPEAPTRGEAEGQFVPKANAFVGALEPFRQQLQAQADFVNERSTETEENAALAQEASEMALSSANFAGDWSGLTGAFNVPTSVLHDDTYWQLLEDVSNIQDDEPGVSDAWAPILVARSVVLALPDITALSSLNTGALADGQQFSVGSYLPNTSTGSCLLRWRPDLPKSRHDGVLFFSLTVPMFTGTNTTDYRNGVGETDSSGSGVMELVRGEIIYDATIDPSVIGWSVKDALMFAASLRKSDVRVHVSINEPLTESVFLVATDLTGVVLTSDSGTISASTDSFTANYAFRFVACLGLELAALVEFEEGTNEVSGFILQEGSTIIPRNGAGVDGATLDGFRLQSSSIQNRERGMIARNCGRDNIDGRENSELYTRGADLSNAGRNGVAGVNFKAEFSESDLTGCGNRAIDCGSGCYFNGRHSNCDDSAHNTASGIPTAVRCSNNGNLNFRGGTARNSGGNGLSAESGIANCREADFSGAAGNGINARSRSLVTFTDGNARKTEGVDSPNDIYLYDGGSIVDATRALGGVSFESLTDQSFARRNKMTGDGIVFDSASEVPTSGFNSAKLDTGGDSRTEYTRALVATTEARVTGERSAVIGSQGCEILSPADRSVIAGSADSKIEEGNRAFIGGSNACETKAGVTGILGSFQCETTASWAVVVGSRRTINGVQSSLAIGDATSGEASTANRSIHLFGGTGNIDIAGSVNSGATFSDFAEMFPNESGEEIEAGIILTHGESGGVKPAGDGDDIAGVVSHTAAVLAGNDSFCWKGRYLIDEFGRPLFETVTEINDENEEVEVTRRIENPEYDPEASHESRLDRPAEWTPVALLGQVYVRVGENVSPGDKVKAGGGGVGEVSDYRTGLKCLKITSEYDADRGYAVAYCLINIQV